jgi:DNA replication and repair protein RecF
MITDIHLQHFRSYSDESFELSPNVNIIVGPNASGKTNLLESILVASRGGSYRAKDLELIEFDKSWLRIEANFGNINRVIKIQKNSEGKTDKSYETNTNKTKRLNLSQTIPTVLFEPNHLLLLIGSPELRRNYLDDILEQTIVGYKTLKSQYKRALAQRNSLLKRTDLKSPELFVWNIRLSELGGKIYKERTVLIEKLMQEVSRLYDLLSSGEEKVELIYKTNVSTTNYESDLLNKLEKTSESDKLRGFTTHGPHRDDLLIYINNKPANEVASRGETRTILLSLKIIEAIVIQKTRNVKPIFLLDDVFGELDGARRVALIKLITNYQSFITTTDADMVLQHFTESASIIPTKK